ncbi:atp synthase subunit e [Ceratocystis lukuohia]|uniref:ATP synthase F(0) complex subunit e, mitochondrial n=3 Tax=Ceratocystis TaxID=5157 RepID=A0A0F8BY35_CERFI|nr:ATP synthase subunit e mitochondrial [Ceratocystis platani]PHH53998.1 hypothetical protein CFIMG_000965RA [Ceratocystis fimbriata CBS 114723]
MSSATTLNVLRWSSLAFGVFYGFTHQRAIRSEEKAAAAKHEYEHKESLIAKAKAEYAKNKNPAPASSQSVDFTDPNFDFEAFFNNMAKA